MVFDVVCAVNFMTIQTVSTLIYSLYPLYSLLPLPIDAGGKGRKKKKWSILREGLFG